MLNARHLAFEFKGRKVLEDVSFDVNHGEIVGCLGINGAGKSTLFRLLSGIYCLQQGEIAFRGQQVARAGVCVSGVMRAHMGVVFQEPSVDQKLSAYMNLFLAGRLFSLGGHKLVARIDEMLTLVNLSTRALEQVKTFSGGMKRRLELARAMLHEPQFLLMDEPSAGLDAEGFHRFWGLVEGLREQRGLSAFVATHRIDEAERCDRLIVLHEGKIIAEGTPGELKARVQGDRITLTLRENCAPEERTACVKVLQERFAQLDFQEDEDEIRVIADDGHMLVPRLVENLPKQTLASVQLRKPSLSDAFLLLTGAELER